MLKLAVGCQERPKRPQETPRRPQERAKRGQERPKIGPRAAQETPRAAQEAPRSGPGTDPEGPGEAPERPGGPRGRQGAPRRARRGPREAHKGTKRGSRAATKRPQENNTGGDKTRGDKEDVANQHVSTSCQNVFSRPRKPQPLDPRPTSCVHLLHGSTLVYSIQKKGTGSRMLS